jgi:prepilin-type N-terminal cleavage/methylation domain-containing protein
MKKLRPHGFTLIEVAIVIALMMFLALFVYPTYSAYLKRAKVTDSLVLASTAKIAVLHNATNNIPLTSPLHQPIR